MDRSQPKKFNTTGVCVPYKHYMLPVLPRIPDVTDMIEGEYYFILHAPRQSGKTTFIESLTDKINLESNYYALYCDLSPLRDTIDKEEAVEEIVDQINVSLASSEVDELNKTADTYNSIVAIRGPGSKVRMLLIFICLRNSGKKANTRLEAKKAAKVSPLNKYLIQTLYMTSFRKLSKTTPTCKPLARQRAKSMT
ncbi:MAG: hypothetical protein LBO05_10860 [Deltaproteobacteria bacterium]|jgi:hypothetical protein|nr:hypothetical protein [Deltaproteobacteria bacterium]